MSFSRQGLPVDSILREDEARGRPQNSIYSNQHQPYPSDRIPLPGSGIWDGRGFGSQSFDARLRGPTYAPGHVNSWTSRPSLQHGTQSMWMPVSRHESSRSNIPRPSQPRSDGLFQPVATSTRVHQSLNDAPRDASSQPRNALYMDRIYPGSAQFST